MNMNDYLTQNYNRLKQKVRAITRNHQNSDDLFVDLVTNLLEKPSEYQKDLLDKGKIEHWIMSSAKLQFNSKTSPFYYRYKKFSRETSPIYEDYITTDDELVENMGKEVLDFISKELELYSIYERTLTREHIFQGKSFSEIAREYKINRKYISETVTPVKTEVFDKVKELWKHY